MKPDYAIIEEKRRGSTQVLTVDTKKATYQGMPWLSMGDYGKRKFETLLMLERMPQLIKLIYV